MIHIRDATPIDLAGLVHTSYLICATPRSGSYLLCEALTNTGLAGHPAEYFWRDHQPFWAARWGAATDRAYVTAAVRETSTPNGVFGMKTMWPYMEYFAGMVRALSADTDRPAPTLLTSVFPNLHHIWITRRDKVRQAISHFRALETGVWMWKEDRPCAAGNHLTFDGPAIDALIRQTADEESSWHDYFTRAGITPFTVVYEDLVDDYETTALRILQYLGIAAPDGLAFSPRHMRRQSRSLSDAWVEQYKAFRNGRDWQSPILANGPIEVR